MLTNPYLSHRMNHIDSSEIRRVFALASSLKNPVNLSIGQPHFPTPKPIVEAINKALKDGHTSYTLTQGILPLREALANKFLQENNFTASPDQILISPGVAALIHLFMMSCIDPGDEILITDPCFLIYNSMLTFLGAKTSVIPENFKRQDIDELSKKKFKFIIYCSPSNPSGFVMNENNIKMLGDLADKTGAILVADEIYEKFDYDGNFKSAASIYPGSLVFSGFSKSWNMTGLRLAAVATSDECKQTQEIINSMTTIQQYTFVCAPAPVQWAGIVALNTDIKKHIAQYKANRDLCLEKLRGKYNIDLPPEGAFYIFPKLPKNLDDNTFVKRAIKEKELLVVPGRIFTNQTDRIRISYATNAETLQKGLAALNDLV